MSSLEVRIAFADGWTGSYANKASLERLGSEGHAHIHGRLEIQLGERPLPYLGYWGPDDVCLDTWLGVLLDLFNRTGTSKDEFVFDEGEQGQPAFVFRRHGDQVGVSIEDSRISDGRGDPAWADVRCDRRQLRGEVRRFLAWLRDDLAARGPATRQWWERQAGRRELPWLP